ELIVGSNNLTEGGLYTNYEAANWTSFNLKEDRQAYEETKYSLHKFIEPSGPTVQPLTKELIDRLAEKEIVISEKVRKTIERDNLEATKSGQPEISPKKQRPALPFSSESIPTPPRLQTKREIKQPVEKIVYPPSSPEVEMRLVWRKEDLPSSDVQIPTEKTTNVTGGLRLTQANWEVNDQVIDQTSYFRNEILGGLEWTMGINPPKKRETTIISCKVVILNKDYGVQKFVISHKPSGEAGQRNYTTMLHWGEMGQIIQEQNLVGKTLFLYAPVDPQEGLFRIEIK
ncbi:hypothetical protein L0152_28275, partial [bacterium]|nr:hypothetical protein [bacterium]